MRLPTLAACLLVSASAPAAPADPLAPYRWTSRVVVASAPQPDDPALVRQRRIFAEMGGQARARDLVLVEAVGDGAQARALRALVGLRAGEFGSALVGKDGETKLLAAHPLDAATLLPVIDAMPMRRQERRERGE